MKITESKDDTLSYAIRQKSGKLVKKDDALCIWFNGYRIEWDNRHIYIVEDYGNKQVKKLQRM